MKGWRVYCVVCLTRPALSASDATPTVTPAPQGPFHVKGRTIRDRAGHPFLIRGTALPGIGLKVAGYAPDSATALITIRQRWNMNAVRIPVDLAEFARDAGYLAKLGAVVRRANSLELLAIVAASSDAPQFWRVAAGYFQDNPNLMLAPSAADVPVIRAAGARQIVLVTGVTADPNAIREMSPSWREPLVIPDDVFVNGLDLQLDRPAPCAELPRDPAALESWIERTLTDFDARGISWTISSFEPGHLINDYRFLGVSRVDDGWTCGGPRDDHAGIGMAVQFHQWRAELRGLLVVNETTGGFVLARGGIAIGYGPIFADKDTLVPERKFRAALAGVTARVTDSQGVSRPAQISYVSGGWGQINLLVPAESAAGPAQVAVQRKDGTQSTANVVIDDVAPGIWSGYQNGRGAAMGFAEPGGTPSFRCRPGAWTCDARRISLPATVRFRANGLRYTGAAQDLRVTVGGVVVRGATIRRNVDPGVDDLVLELPRALQGMGEVDLMFRLKGRLSNVVRINLGAGVADQTQAAKTELGRYLFYDKRMSVSGTASCATCHHQELAFTDGKARSEGATGVAHPRSAMSLVNVAELSVLTWSNPSARSLENQALTPMFSHSPVELGVDEARFLALLRGDRQAMFHAAFPEDRDPVSTVNVTRAIAAFERTIRSRRSPYDRYRFDDERDAISESAKRGEVLFFSPSIGCGRCHSGPDFTDGSFHNTALYDPYLEPNTGIDHGKFRTPTLRNIALTAPYMHDGSIATLDAVLDHYAAGGRTHNAAKDAKLTGFYLSPQNRADLLAFLACLTDHEVIYDPRFSDPF